MSIFFEAKYIYLLLTVYINILIPEWLLKC